MAFYLKKGGNVCFYQCQPFFLGNIGKVIFFEVCSKPQIFFQSHALKSVRTKSLCQELIFIQVELLHLKKLQLSFKVQALPNCQHKLRLVIIAANSIISDMLCYRAHLSISHNALLPGKHRQLVHYDSGGVFLGLLSKIALFGILLTSLVAYPLYRYKLKVVT